MRGGTEAITGGREEEGNGGRTRGEGSMPVARTTTAPDLPSIHPGAYFSVRAQANRGRPLTRACAKVASGSREDPSKSTRGGNNRSTSGRKTGGQQAPPNLSFRRSKFRRNRDFGPFFSTLILARLTEVFAEQSRIGYIDFAPLDFRPPEFFSRLVIFRVTALLYPCYTRTHLDKPNIFRATSVISNRARFDR